MTHDQDDFIREAAAHYAAHGRFGHREHLEVCVAAHRRFGAGALPALRAFIRHLDASHGDGTKYHETLTRFWTALTAHTLQSTGAADVDALLDAQPLLLDARLAERHWSRDVLFSPEARAGWVAPDVLALPFSA